MVTVLMATYRGKQYLEQQLDTILAQTVPVKILISDDGSDDGTREMLENYAGWYPEQVFLHHRTQHTGGAAGNFFWLMQEALKDEKMSTFSSVTKMMSGRITKSVLCCIE